MTQTRPGAPLAPSLVVSVLALVSPMGAHSASAYLPRSADSTANSADRPDPGTPLPPHYAESYAAYVRMKSAARGGTQYKRATYSRMPDWSGLWTSASGFKFDTRQEGSGVFGLGPTTAKLTPRYQAALDEKLRRVAKGLEWDQLSDCLPAGYPRWYTEPFLREFIVTPDQTWWINEMQGETRRIYTDGRGHIPEDAADRLWDGDSIGFWDGDVLVVHTIRVRPGQYQRNQPEYSHQTSTVERIRKVDPDTIESDVTVWDPMGLREPWRVVHRFSRVTTEGARIDTWSCNANNNVVRTPEGGSQFILKGETLTIQQGYKDPDTFYLSDVQKKLFAEDEAEESRNREVVQ